MRTAAIIQARMGSTRLPGKVLMPLAGRPMLEHVIRRTQAARGIDAVVVATTTADRDAPLVALAEGLGARAFRGSEEDVLARYVGAARMVGAELIVRITSDCPLYDPALLTEMLEAFHRTGGDAAWDAYTNTARRTYPRGLDTEIVPANVLARVEAEAADPRAREHVTWHLYQHPDQFRIGHHAQDTDESAGRWTVDTPEDFAFAEQVFARLHATNPLFGRGAVHDLLRREPAIAALNAHVEQKKI